MAHTLTDAQTATLFDILSHYNTYAEIRNFRQPGSLKHYGPPFSAETKTPSTSPALQTLVSRFLLNLPGLKDLPHDFWKVQCHDVIENLENAELSESYDKGAVGSRKTLSTAISALIEYPARGTYGGFAKVQDANHDYDLSNADDLSRAFRDFLDQAIYGTILEDMVKKTSETDKLSDHGPLTQAVHEFVLVNVASLMHFTLVLSPKGQYLVKLMSNINQLIPYVVVRQTLKIGNVASMINAMVKIGLAKMSIASVTNWMGLTQTEDEGMNLMQQIISTVLSWDNKDLESRASKIEKDKNPPDKKQLQALKDYQNKSRADHERIRKRSQDESISIVTAVLSDASVSTDLSDQAHKQALDYLAIHLSIRDRKEIIKILCHSNPDHLTTSVRALVSAYEPVIRQLHNAIDLADTVYDMEMFLRDMFKLAKVQPPGKDGKSVVPTVGDFVALLKKHQYSCHKFIHQCCKNGKDVTGWYLEWAKTAASQFKMEGERSSAEKGSGAGDLTSAINDLFSGLPSDKQEEIIPILDIQTKYLEEIHASSKARLESVIKSPPSKNPIIAKIVSSSSNNSSSRPGSRPGTRPSSPAPGGREGLQRTPTSTNVTSDPSQPPPSIDSDPGPGAYLARWQDLLDSTPITPLTPKGEVKKASSKEVEERSATDVNGLKTADLKGSTNKVEKPADSSTTAAAGGSKAVQKPDTRIVVEALGKEFRKLLAERSLNW